MKVIFFANTDWYLYNFRLDFARALRKAGHEVVLLSPEGPYRSKIQDAGFRWLEFPLSRRGMNPFIEAFTILRLIRIYQQEKPDIVHHYTIKCVVYGSTAAHIGGVKKIINSITGLGYVFLNKGYLAGLLRGLTVLWYRIILAGTKVIFLNRDDMEFFIRSSMVKHQDAVFIAGDGVDMDHFSKRSAVETDNPLVVLVSRMLFDKGIAEYVEAARLIKNTGIRARFALVGNIDDGNPSAISQTQIETWQREGCIEWWGWRDNMVDVYHQAEVGCLPSYREGLPKMLIEAGACGLPLVASDVPGCRDVVSEGDNGFLVPPGDAGSLAEALTKLVVNPTLRKKMGQCSRELINRKYALPIIIEQTMAVYGEP